MWACTQRAAEFHGAAVGFDVERNSLGILDLDASEICMGFQFPFGTSHCDGAAVGMQVVGGSQCLLQFDLAEVILHFDFLADSYLHQGHSATIRFDTERIAGAVLKGCVAKVGLGVDVTCRADFTQCDGAAV